LKYRKKRRKMKSQFKRKKLPNRKVIKIGGKIQNINRNNSIKLSSQDISKLSQHRNSMRCPIILKKIRIKQNRARIQGFAWIRIHSLH